MKFFDKMKFLRHMDGHLWPILAIGLLVLFVKCYITYPVQHVGESDASGYAEMADCLVHGKWLNVEYISFFFIKYSGIPRPEDHWPPLYSFLIAPFYLLLGKTAFASKLPSLIISSLFLPLATYFLAKSFSRNKWASMGAAFTVMFYPSLFLWSLYCLSDITYSFVFCLAVLFAVKGMDNGRYFYPMGFLLGLGYYAKGATLVLIPAFPIFYLIVRGSWKALVKDRRFLLGLLLAFLVIAPWWLRNTIHFGNPFHSTQNYWSGYIGYGSGSSYHVYWGEELKPSFFTTKMPLGIKHVAKKAKEYMDTNLQWALVDMPAKPGSDPPINLKYFITFEAIRACFRPFPKYPLGIPIGFLGIPTVLGLICLWRNRKIYIVPLVSGALILFLSIFWGPIDRLVLPTVALVAALGWTSYSALLNKFRDWFGRVNWISRHANQLSVLLLLCGTLIVVVYNANANVRLWREAAREGKYPYVDSERKKNRIIAGHWLRDNTSPDAIAMDSEPWDLHFYSDRKTVHMPYDALERILLVMQTYGVTHITYHGQGSLQPLYRGDIPGFELVNEKGLKIYQVRYELLPEQYRFR